MNGKRPYMDYPQYRAARRLVHECCNYDNGNCILLDNGEPCVCVQSISYSLICRWFRIAVLCRWTGNWKPPYSTGQTGNAVPKKNKNMTRILLTLSLICLIMTGCSNSNEPIEFEDETQTIDLAEYEEVVL